ncbi:MAG: hypothetical protein QOE70_2789 [Chthoniobacter sp.]|jgi:acetyl esterase/lipase|nr:hypothetical protein [Chthoniobacter sp.]
MKTSIRLACLVVTALGATLCLAEQPLGNPFANLKAPSPEAVQRILKELPAADTNQDGALSPQEIRAAMPQLQQRGLAMAALGLDPTAANAHYGPHERNVLDFWKAESATPTPVLIHIHGGGFIAGDKAQLSPLAVSSCLSAGISFASINYRYTTQEPYPAPMLDGARAIQFLRSKAAEWNIDPERVGAFGGSAGAGISMWVGFHDDLARPDSADPIERQSTRLKCIGSMGGQASYDPLQIREWLGGQAWQHPAFKPFYAVKSDEEFEKPEVRKLANDASVINHLTKDDPPLFMIYSEPDAPLSNDSAPGTGIHHPKFGHLLKEKMDALGIEAIYRHTGDGQQPSPPEHMLKWFQERLLAPAK